MKKKLSTFCQKFLTDNKGQTLTEYAMIIIFVVILAIATVTFLGESIILVFFEEMAAAL